MTEVQAHFLRTYYPDIDIPGELIREEIDKDARITRELRNYDPYVGNLLESFLCSETGRKSSAYLAFPTGNSNRELSRLTCVS